MLPAGLGILAASPKALEAARSRHHAARLFPLRRHAGDERRRLLPLHPAHPAPARPARRRSTACSPRASTTSSPATAASPRACAAPSPPGASTPVAEHPSLASDTVTAIRVPAGVDARDVIRAGYHAYNTSFGTGLGPLAGKAFRIGHLGDLNEVMCLAAARRRRDGAAGRRRRRRARLGRRRRAGLVPRRPRRPRPEDRRRIGGPHGHPRIPGQGNPRPLRRAGAPRRPRLQPRAGRLPGPRDRRPRLGGQGADPFRRPRPGRRRDALPHRGGGADLRRHPLRPHPGHEADRRGRQGRLSRLGRGGLATSPASSISASCSTANPSAS